MYPTASKNFIPKIIFRIKYTSLPGEIPVSLSKISTLAELSNKLILAFKSLPVDLTLIFIIY